MEANDTATSPLTKKEVEDALQDLSLVFDLKFFSMTAPVNWHENQVIRRYYLSAEQGFVSCVYHNNLYFITGTDIVRCVTYKLQMMGRKVIDRKKLEEGIFSDLRQLKCGKDAILERPKSEFLSFLHRNQCLRTQKKQKVFYWFSVPHDKIFQEALKRDLEREQDDAEPATVAESKLMKRFKYDRSVDFVSQIVNYIHKETGEDYSKLFGDAVDDKARAIKLVEECEAMNDTGETTPIDLPDMDTEASAVNTDGGEEEFPMDYLDDSSNTTLFNVDGVGSVTECPPSNLTYVPGSAYVADQPALWLVSPTGMQMPDNLLIDQATPMVSTFPYEATPRSARVKTEPMEQPSQSLYTFIPGSTTISGGLRTSSNVKVEETPILGTSDQTIQPQILTVPATGFPGVTGSAGPYLFSPDQGVHLLYGASPCYTDYPILPFSRPLSGIKTTFDEKATNRSSGVSKPGKKSKKTNAKSRAAKQSAVLNSTLRRAGIGAEPVSPAVTSARTPTFTVDLTNITP